MTTLRGRASDLGYAAGWRLVRALPERAAGRLFDAGADYAARRGGGPEQLRRNLARVLGVAPDAVPDELIRAAMRSYARYWREAFRLPSMDLPAVAARMARYVVGGERVDDALRAGSGAILALPHSGNWDMAGVFAVGRWGEFATVAERLEPEALFRRFVRYRETLGFEILPASGGAVAPAMVLAERLRRNRVICLLGERDLSGRGVPVTFFGAPTSMPAGPAKLAIDTGAPLFPVHCWFAGDAWGVSVGEPVDVAGGIAAGTQALADAFAAGIAAHPADWHMLQPLWFDDLSAERRARVVAGGGR
jgi:KDO2-lipid IV(A) lauroyltransferase